MNTDHIYGSPDGRERRRAVRRRVEDQPAAMPIVAPVRVMDISRTGVLLAADCRFSPGDSGTLCVDINGSSLTASREVKRVAPGRTGAHRLALGASFLPLNPDHDRLPGHI